MCALSQSPDDLVSTGLAGYNGTLHRFFRNDNPCSGRTNLVLGLFFSVAAGDYERSRKVSQEVDWLDCVADQFRYRTTTWSKNIAETSKSGENPICFGRQIR